MTGSSELQRMMVRVKLYFARIYALLVRYKSVMWMRYQLSQATIRLLFYVGQIEAK